MSIREKILSEALDLSPIERAKSIEDLFTSFNFLYKEEIDKEWAKEAESRIDAYESGKITSIPINDIFNNIK